MLRRNVIIILLGTAELHRSKRALRGRLDKEEGMNVDGTTFRQKQPLYSI